MEIEGCKALVTGANRGLGRAFADALLEAGASKVYAGARDPSTITDPRLSPVKLDVTSERDVMDAATLCGDVDLLINNAGVLRNCPMLADGAAAAMRVEMEVNAFGLLRMVSAFAPILAKQGGGAIVNILSVASWFTDPFMATYGASKHAALVVSDAARVQLAKQGTPVVGVYAGYIDTEMAAHVSGPKTPAAQVVQRTLDAVRRGETHVMADDRAGTIRARLQADPAGIEGEMQQRWDRAHL